MFVVAQAVPCSVWRQPSFTIEVTKMEPRARAVNALLAKTTMPVLAACDIDPAGLGIAPHSEAHWLVSPESRGA